MAVISDGQCWDLANFSDVRLSSFELFKSSFAEARLVLVLAFRQPENELGASLELYKREQFSLAAVLALNR